MNTREKTILQSCINLLDSTLEDMPSRLADQVVGSVKTIIKSLTEEQPK